MAKAIFHCSECGDDVVIVGTNRKEADRKAAWHQSQGHICSACEANLRDQENARAAAANFEAGLPAMTGSEKQVAWAETLRKETLTRLDALSPVMATMQSMDFVETCSADERAAIKARLLTIMNSHEGLFMREWIRENAEDLMRELHTNERFTALVDVMRRQTSARWWIDSRDTRLSSLARTLRDDIDREMSARRPVTAEQAEIVREAEVEAILKPVEEPASRQIAEISMVGKEIRVAFAEKNEDFRLLMRGLGFRWAERFWSRTMGITTGNPIDRMAETAHRILGSKFMVRIYDSEARSKAISGEFEQEQRRWVTKCNAGEYSGWCRIEWAKTDDLYAPAKRLLGARYNTGHVYVPPGSVLEVADFAANYGFSLSPGVQEMLDAHRAALLSGAVICDPKQAPIPIKDDGRITHLDHPEVEIDEDLKD